MILYSILSTHHFSFAFVGIAAKSEAQWKIGTWWHNAEACPLTKISGVFSNFEKNNLSNADQIYVKFNKKIWILRLNNYDQMGDKDVCIKCSLMYLPFDITQTTHLEHSLITTYIRNQYKFRSLYSIVCFARGVISADVLLWNFHSVFTVAQIDWIIHLRNLPNSSRLYCFVCLEHECICRNWIIECSKFIVGKL